MCGSARLSAFTCVFERISCWIGSVTSHTFTFIPASTRPSFIQNAMNSRFPASPRITTSSYDPGGAQPEYSMPRSYWSEKK